MYPHQIFPPNVILLQDLSPFIMVTTSAAMVARNSKASLKCENGEHSDYVMNNVVVRVGNITVIFLV